MRVTRYRGKHLRARPRTGGAAAVGAAASVCITGSASAHSPTYLVRPGDTLSSIASRYGTTVGRLAAANDLANPNFIVSGTRLAVSGTRSALARRTHLVRAGETLSEIAVRFGTSVAALARANNIADPNMVIAGTRLSVPSTGAVAARSASASRSVGPIESLLEGSAATHGIDAALVKAIAWQESGWQQHAVSSAGAIGVMQVMPGTADLVNSWTGSDLDVRHAGHNIELGVRYLRHLLDIMPTEAKAVAGYYTGPGAVGRRLSRIQRPYVRNVMALKNRY